MQQLLLVLSPHLIKLKATFPIQAGRDTREKSRSWVWRQKSAVTKLAGWSIHLIQQGDVG